MPENMIYQRLKPGYFRIVEFIASPEQHHITCSLDQCLLDADTSPPLQYDALSYTWGDHEKTESIEINGHPMFVTWNLYFALYNLQANHRKLWIDALCIDQDDLEERESQVQEMSKIYKQAVNVVVWLGESTPEIAALMKPLTSLQLTLELYEADQKPFADMWDERWIDYYTKARLVLKNTRDVFRQELGLKILMARPWFTRIWIIQEVANARSIHVYCGQDRVSGRMFAILPSLLNVTVGKHRQAIMDVMRGESGNSSWWNESRSLLMLLRRFRRSQASEARDRIYALLGICSDDVSSLVPSYHITDQEVIAQTLLYLFGQAGHFSLTSGMQFPTISNFLEDLENLYREALTFYEIEVDDPETIQAALEKWTDPARNANNLETLRFILSHPAAERLRLTPSMITWCGNDDKTGASLMRLLMNHCGDDEICIKNDGFEAIWWHEDYRKMVRLLLDWPGTRLELTMDMILAVLYALNDDEDTVKLLLDCCTNQIHIITILGEVASADPPATGDKVVGLLLRKKDPDLVFNDDVAAIILKRSSNDNVKLFLQKHG